MVEVSNYGSDYLLLGLRIDKHRKGYVDYYYGPPELKALADSEPKKTPEELQRDCKRLITNLSDQGFDEKREKYLEKTLDAIDITIKTELLDVKKPVKEIFEALTNMELRPYRESQLDDLKEQCDEAYSGTGTLSEKMAEMRKKRTIPKDKVMKAFQKGLDIVERRTRELFPDLLPKEESIELQAITSDGNIKWVAYDGYKGNFKSLVEVNTEYCTYWTGFLRLGAHEGYPGHHTEFVVAEDKLYRRGAQFERGILLYPTPYMIICEGIADMALNALFSYQEQEQIVLREFCPDSANKPSIEELVQQSLVRKNFRMFDYNAAYHKLIDKWSDDEVIEYLTSFEIYNNEMILNIVKTINNPVFAITSFTHQLGRNLIINKFGDYPSPKNFRYLLENPILPSDLT